MDLFLFEVWHEQHLTAFNLLSFSTQSFESASPSLRSSNLSALKKRWEQAGTIDHVKSSIPPPVQSSSLSTPVALTTPTPISENPPPLKSSGPLTAQEGQRTANCAQKPSAGMDRDELTHNKRPEKLEEQVPTSPCVSYEKPRVPLNNLRMRFEKGEENTEKVKNEMFLLLINKKCSIN